MFSVKRVKNRGNKDLGVIAQHRNSEAENSPAVGHERVLPPAVRLEEIVSCSLVRRSSIADFCDAYGSNRDPFSGSGLTGLLSSQAWSLAPGWPGQVS